MIRCCLDCDISLAPCFLAFPHPQLYFDDWRYGRIVTQTCSEGQRNDRRRSTILCYGMYGRCGLKALCEVPPST